MSTRLVVFFRRPPWYVVSVGRRGSSSCSVGRRGTSSTLVRLTLHSHTLLVSPPHVLLVLVVVLLKRLLEEHLQMGVRQFCVLTKCRRYNKMDMEVTSGSWYRLVGHQKEENGPRWSRVAPKRGNQHGNYVVVVVPMRRRRGSFFDFLPSQVVDVVTPFRSRNRRRRPNATTLHQPSKNDGYGRTLMEQPRSVPVDGEP